MHHILSKAPLIALFGAGLLLSGCATKESVEHAQATADSAKADAASAMSAAQRAQSAADAAESSAHAAAAAAQNANDRLDHLPPPVVHHGRMHHHRHHHHRHHAMKAPDAK